MGGAAVKGELMMARYIVWFSCGAASAVAAKVAIEQYGTDHVYIVYCDTSASEHSDNVRFLADVEEWIGKKVTIIRSTRYQNIDDVFEKTRYMAGPQGARCTVEMKKVPRHVFQFPDDAHVFGFTADEAKRVTNFTQRNPELDLAWVLLDAGITKQMCYAELTAAGIDLPKMYLLGYRNNNCIGCVKVTSPGYWDKVAADFPGVFAKRAEQSRRLGVRLTRVKGQRVFLDELSLGKGLYRYRRENISCGPECGTWPMKGD